MSIQDQVNDEAVSAAVSRAVLAVQEARDTVMQAYESIVPWDEYTREYTDTVISLGEVVTELMSRWPDLDKVAD